MQVPIHSPADLGLAIRAVRRASKVRIDDLADTSGVSKQFTSDVEYGKPGVRLGLVFKLLNELGLPLILDIPEEAETELRELKANGGARASRIAVHPAPKD